MRYLTLPALFVLAVASAPADTLILFDGRDASKWVIEGEHKIEDGILIVGGSKAARFRPAADLSGEWALFLEENHSGSCGYDLAIARFMGGKGSAGGSGTRGPNQWLETTYSVAVSPKTNRNEFRHQQSGYDQPIIIPFDGEITKFWITLPAGETMKIRSAKLTITPASPLKKLFLPIVSLIAFLIVVALLVVVLRRFRSAPEERAEMPQ